MLRKIIISTKCSLVHSQLFSFRSKKKLSAQKSHFLCWNFFLQNIRWSSQKYLFLSFRVDHCPLFLFAEVAAKITFLFLIHFLLEFSPSLTKSLGENKTENYLICIFYDQLFLQRKHRYNISVHGGLQKRYNSNNFVSSNSFCFCITGLSLTLGCWISSSAFQLFL